MDALDLLNEAIDFHLVDATREALALGADPNRLSFCPRIGRSVPALGRALVERETFRERVPMTLFETLVQGGAHLDGGYGLPLFNLACLQVGHAGTVRAMFNAGYRPEWDFRCLFTLHLPVLAYLVEEQGMDLNREVDRRGTPLHHAIRFERADLVAWMLDHGANLEGTDYAGFTPLLVACECQATELITLLLARGANATAANASGDTALHLVNHSEAAQALIEAGAPLAVVNDRGYFPGENRTPATLAAIEAWQLRHGNPMQSKPTSIPSRRL